MFICQSLEAILQIFQELTTNNLQKGQKRSTEVHIHPLPAGKFQSCHDGACCLALHMRWELHSIACRYQKVYRHQIKYFTNKQWFEHCSKVFRQYFETYLFKENWEFSTFLQLKWASFIRSVIFYLFLPREYKNSST